MTAAAALIAVVTLIAGAAAGWFAARFRHANGDTSTLATTTAERDAARAELSGAKTELATVRSELRDAEVRAAEAASKVATIAEAQEQLKDTFARLSDEALTRSNSKLVELADSKLRTAGAPIAETLTRVETQLREIETNRASAAQALATQIDLVRRTGDDLRRETGSLVDALRKPQARGRWGELQLRRCVELAGMSDRCDFDEQVTVSTADGVLRPDLVVRLAGGKHVVVDSKVTLAAYLEAHEATSDDLREQRLDAHARHLRAHVDSLAAKAYWSQFSPAPEFVILFVPGEAFLAPALDRDTALLDYAFSKKVHIATPTTLLSMLRTVAYAWQQETLAENAQAVFDLGRELYKRIGTFGGHMDKLGRSLESAVKTYNNSVGSLEKQVLVTARKLSDLQLIDGDLELTGGIEEPIRSVRAAELVESAEDSRAVVALPAVMAWDPSQADIDEDYGLNVGDTSPNIAKTL